jgi:hypothetical protein
VKLQCYASFARVFFVTWVLDEFLAGPSRPAYLLPLKWFPFRCFELVTCIVLLLFIAYPYGSETGPQRQTPLLGFP